MSKQSGLIKLKGNIGGISFYKSDGEDLARMANGPDKKRILNDPAFERTRENNAEFGGSATAAKALRTALAPVIQNVADSKLTSRLTQIFKQLNSKGTGNRGQRAIALSENKTMLNNLEFNLKSSFSSVFYAPVVASNNKERTEGTITLTSDNSHDQMNPPSGATHYRLIHALGVVSDYLYNDEIGSYEAVDPAVNGLNAVTYSAYTPIGESIPAGLVITTPLTGITKLNTQVSVIQCLGIEFFQQVGGNNYLLAQGNSLKIVRVF